MCDYCKVGKRLPDVDDRDIHNGAYVFVDDDDKEISVVLEDVNYFTGEEMESMYINVPVNYCPMCGRRLNERRRIYQRSSRLEHAIDRTES